MPTKSLLFLALKGLLFLSVFAFTPLLGVTTQIACGCEEPFYPYYKIPEPTQTLPEAVVAPTETSPTVTPSQETVIRAAIDIGSGATKLRVAEVNLKTEKVVKVLVNESFPVHYQERLHRSSDNLFDSEVMQTGIDAIKKSADIAKQYHAQGIVAVATASFRKADNSDEYINKIYQETGVKVHVIDQDLEGKLAFNAVLADGNYTPDDLIVWDIGGGSFQLTALNKDGSYQLFGGVLASTGFKNLIIEKIQHKDFNSVHTPNPMNIKEIKDSTAEARAVAQKVDAVFKERIVQPNTKIVGVGNIFAYGLFPAVGKKSPFTQQDLDQAVLGMAGKDDEQLGGGHYANVLASNLILILGYMQTLDIPKMEVMDVNNADGAMLYQEFWK